MADGVGDLIRFQNQRMGQNHLDGRTYVEKEIVERENSVSDATTPMVPPTAAPMTVLFPGLPGPVTLDVRQPGGGPVHPGGSVLVMVLG